MTLPRTHRRTFAAVGVLASAAMVTAMASAPATAVPSVGEIRSAGGATAVADSYIVVLKDSSVGGR
ncbi:S8 family peptidase, partial [Micromonospora sp. NPDC023956]